MKYTNNTGSANSMSLTFTVSQSDYEMFRDAATKHNVSTRDMLRAYVNFIVNADDDTIAQFLAANVMVMAENDRFNTEIVTAISAARSEGLTWKQISGRFGISVPHARRILDQVKRLPDIITPSTTATIIDMRVLGSSFTHIARTLNVDVYIVKKIYNAHLRRSTQK